MEKSPKEFWVKVKGVQQTVLEDFPFFSHLGSFTALPLLLIAKLPWLSSLPFTYRKPCDYKRLPISTLLIQSHLQNIFISSYDRETGILWQQSILFFQVFLHTYIWCVCVQKVYACEMWMYVFIYVEAEVDCSSPYILRQGLSLTWVHHFG